MPLLDHHGNVLGPGLYRAARRKIYGFGDHYGVLSVDVLQPGTVVVDLNNEEQIQVRTFENWMHGKPEYWIRGECPHEAVPAAVARLQYAIANHTGYKLLRNNCEHFATWVVDGRHVSSQAVRVMDFVRPRAQHLLRMGLHLALRRFFR
jgi:hypothetical protein